MADLREKIVKAIADACDIEESVAEFGASAVLDIPEIRDALAVREAMGREMWESTKGTFLA